MGQFADVDDTAAFMAAARSFKLEKEYGKPPASSDDVVSDEEVTQTLVTGEESAAPADTGFGGFEGKASLGLFLLGISTNTSLLGSY